MGKVLAVRKEGLLALPGKEYVGRRGRGKAPPTVRKYTPPKAIR